MNEPWIKLDNVQLLRGGRPVLKGISSELSGRVSDTLEMIGLQDRAKEPVKRFSGGMKRRLNFGCGMVHRPKVLLLDEPTVGVDPQSRVRLLDLVRDQAAAGMCVLYTTHYMEEAEALCDRLAIIDHGVLIAEGTLDELRGMMGERDILRLTGRFDPEKARAALSALSALNKAGLDDTGLDSATLDEAEIVAAEPELLIVAIREASRKLPAIFGALADADSQIAETTLTRPSLETLFIKLTGRELRE